MYGEETYPEADPYGPTTLDEPTPSSALDLDRLVWDPEYRTGLINPICMCPAMHNSNGLGLIIRIGTARRQT